MPSPRGVVCDVDGVLLAEGAPVPGASAALTRLREAGLGVVLLTNITTRRAVEVAARLREARIEVADDEVITAGMLTGEHLQAHHRGARCLVLNAGTGTADLGDVISVDADPEVVVVGSPGPGTFTWEQLSCAYRAVRDGAPLLGMHRSLATHTADGWVLDGGTYLAALEHATAAVATVCGKPSAAAFRQAAAHLGLPVEDVVMVGDDLRVDVLPAQEAGLSGVLVDTGRPDGALEADLGLPERVVTSLAEVPALLGA